MEDFRTITDKEVNLLRAATAALSQSFAVKTGLIEQGTQGERTISKEDLEMLRPITGSVDRRVRIISGALDRDTTDDDLESLRAATAFLELRLSEISEAPPETVPGEVSTVPITEESPTGQHAFRKRHRSESPAAGPLGTKQPKDESPAAGPSGTKEPKKESPAASPSGTKQPKKEPPAAGPSGTKQPKKVEPWEIKVERQGRSYSFYRKHRSIYSEWLCDNCLMGTVWIPSSGVMVFAGEKDHTPLCEMAVTEQMITKPPALIYKRRIFEFPLDDEALRYVADLCQWPELPSFLSLVH